MSSTRYAGPLDGLSRRRDVAAGTLCTADSALPGVLQDRLVRAEAKKLGTPYLESEYWVTRDIPEHPDREVPRRLAATTSRDEVECVVLEWVVWQARLERLLGRSIAPIWEAPGDHEAREAVIGALGLDLVYTTLCNILIAGFEAEGVELTDAMVRQLMDSIGGELMEILCDSTAARIPAVTGVPSQSVTTTYLKRDLQADLNGLAKQSTAKSTSIPCPCGRAWQTRRQNQRYEGKENRRQT